MGRPAFSRAERLASSIKKEIAEMINERQIKEFKDPRLTGVISITDVRVTNGYQHLDIAISVLEPEHEEGVISVLKESTTSLRGEICRRFKLRVAPTISFSLDESIKRGHRVWNLLDEIQENSI